MRTLWLIAKKEMDHSLNSQLAYILILIFVVSLPVPLLWSSGSMNIFLNGHTDMRAFFLMLPLFLMVFVPALAMRAWAEERASGTMELLLSFPIGKGALVLGKFLGLYLILLACILATVPLALLVSRMGDLDWGPVIGGYCAALLLAACCLAVAMGAGALTRNAATAFILGFLLLAILMFLPFPALNPHSRFVSIARGVLDSRDLVFYLLATALFLLINLHLVKGEAFWRVKGIHLAVLTLLLALAFVSQNWFLRRDLTADRLYTLNQASIDLIQNLEKPLHIRLYLSEKLPARFRPVNEYIRTLVDEYASHGGKNIKVTYIDPGTKLELVDEAHKLGIFETKANVAERSRVEMVYIWFGLALFYGEKHEVFPTLSSLENFEYDLTSAITRLSRERRPQVKLLGPTYAGLGSFVFSPDQQLKDLTTELGKSFAVEASPTDSGSLPDLAEADVVIAWGLDRYSEGQLHELDQYLVRGGKLILAASAMWIDPSNLLATPREPGLADDFYRHLGFAVQRNLVCDQSCSKIKYTETRPPVLKDYPLFPALYAERGSFSADLEPASSLGSLILPWVSALELLPEPANPVQIIARSSDQSWLLEGSVNIDPARVSGPTSFESYALGLQIDGPVRSFFEQPPTGSPAHIARGDRAASIQVWGSEQLLTQLQNPSIPTFFSHTVDYLARGASLGEIDRRDTHFRPIREMSLEEKNRYKLLSLSLAPLFIVLFALGRFLSRRNRNVGAWLEN